LCAKRLDADVTARAVALALRPQVQDAAAVEADAAQVDEGTGLKIDPAMVAAEFDVCDSIGGAGQRQQPCAGLDGQVFTGSQADAATRAAGVERPGDIQPPGVAAQQDLMRCQPGGAGQCLVADAVAHVDARAEVASAFRRQASRQCRQVDRRGAVQRQARALGGRARLAA
jgi:hypothetical protein